MARIVSQNRLALLAAFAAIYLVWGSTYLAIVFAIESPGNSLTHRVGAHEFTTLSGHDVVLGTKSVALGSRRAGVPAVLCIGVAAATDDNTGNECRTQE